MLWIRKSMLVGIALALAACHGVDNQTSAVSLSAGAYTVAQNAGSASLMVNRTGPAGTAVSVSYATSADTAVPGTDYTTTTGTLQWAENDMTSKTIIVPLSNTTPFSGNRSFDVALTSPSGTSIGNPGTAKVNITGDAAPTSGSLQLSAATYTVAQSAGTLTVTVNRVDGSAGAVTVNYATANGTAAAGTDYTASSGTLKWADGDATSKTFSVMVSNATAFSGTRTFSVALSSPTGGAGVGSPGSATVTINGSSSPAAGSLNLSAASDSVAQGAGSLTITVDRTGGSSGAVSVHYATADATAVAGRDYTAASGTLQWADGDATPKTFSVAISNATPFTGNKTFTVTLSSPSAGTSISSPGTATVTIAGDAAPAMGSLELSASTYSVAQSAGTVTISVQRTGGSSGAVSANYSTTGGTAVPGTDFTAASGTLQWADGDASAKTFAITISNAAPFSGNKSFTVGLASPTGGAVLGSPTSASVTISGSAVGAVGSLQMSASTYAVIQNAGSVTITVNRTGGSTGAISVIYATADGSAHASTDYTSTSGTLNWASGDANAKTFTVPISNATPFTGTRTFTAALSAPSGGATLATPSSATVTISGASGSGSGGPSAVTDLQLVNQGGPGNNPNSSSNSLTNYQAVSWSAATAGANAISKYNIYRNGALYDTQTTPTTFSGYISGNTLTVTSVASGTVLPIVRYSAPGLATGTFINAAQSSGTAGGAGTYPVNVSQSLGSSGSPVTFTAWVYVDSHATNSNVPNWATPATVYTYNVAAVDSVGNVGPQASQYSAYIYENGFSNCSNGDLNYGGVAVNYSSTAGSPQGGSFDVSATYPGGWQPVSDAMLAPEWDMEVGAFNYLTVDINPGSTTGYQIGLGSESRLPPGDSGHWHDAGNIFQYGPAPVANTWATYKVPLTKLGFGVSTFTGSISGTTLTVTAVLTNPAVGVDSDGYVTGPGVPAGTYVTNYSQAGSVGTFTLAGPGISSSTSVPSTTMTFQRTQYYKSGLQASVGGVTVYYNNLGFTQN